MCSLEVLVRCIIQKQHFHHLSSHRQRIFQDSTMFRPIFSYVALALLFFVATSSAESYIMTIASPHYGRGAGRSPCTGCTGCTGCGWGGCSGCSGCSGCLGPCRNDEEKWGLLCYPKCKQCYESVACCLCRKLPFCIKTAKPTKYPTISPTKYPTKYPTEYPTKYPTNAPTKYPTRFKL